MHSLVLLSCRKPSWRGGWLMIESLIFTLASSLSVTVTIVTTPTTLVISLSSALISFPNCIDINASTVLYILPLPANRNSIPIWGIGLRAWTSFKSDWCSSPWIKSTFSIHSFIVLVATGICLWLLTYPNCSKGRRNRRVLLWLDTLLSQKSLFLPTRCLLLRRLFWMSMCSYWTFEC